MAGDGPRGTILVVDDNPDIRGFAKISLENAGYTAIIAADGVEGLRCYRENRASIMLLLTDIAMPNMNGLELAGHVLAIDCRLPVLVMSGTACGGYQGLESIPKPFRPNQLIETVGRALNTRANPGLTLAAA
jgi:DNA-binding NtrC family response regulator